MAIKGTEIVEKRNILNEVRKNSMSLQELRFFSIYLSKINARDISTRTVRFPLSDFQKIMELGRPNTKKLKATTDSLLSKVVSVPTERGGYKSFQLFKECTIDKDEFECWYVEIDAHDKALPLMFDFKKEYFTYELWNALTLKSANQLRLYELLKQYEKVGERKMTLSEIRNWLGLSDDQYPRWDRFKERVLDSCQQALLENTDIKFEYTAIKAGKKVTGVHFKISKNKKHRNPLTLDDFINQQETLETEYTELIMNTDTETADNRDKREEICMGFEDPLFDEFTAEQLAELRSLAWDNVDPAEVERQNAVLHDITAAKQYAVSKYITEKILMCNARGNRVKHRYAYIRKAVKDNYK